eukprot:3498509-Rhodomonas_salina.2
MSRDRSRFWMATIRRNSGENMQNARNGWKKSGKGRVTGPATLLNGQHLKKVGGNMQNVREQ